MMMLHHRSLVVYLLLLTTSVIVVSTNNDEKSDKNNGNGNGNGNDNDNDNDDGSSLSSSSQCGVYLAESSTSTEDEPKLGMFAGKHYDAKQPLGPPGLAIQNSNMQAHMRSATDADKASRMKHVLTNVEQYFWTSESTGATWETERTGRVITTIPGVGVLGNYHPFLINSDWFQFSGHFRRPLVREVEGGDGEEEIGDPPGVTHPGRGAYTTYYNVSIHSTQPIWAGVEIFSNYGEAWEESAKEDKEEEEEDAEVNRKDYNKLDQVVNQIVEFMDNFKDELTPEAKKDIYTFLTRDVFTAASGKKSAELTKLFPSDPEELHKVQQEGGILLYREKQIKKSIDWLEQHGQCMDNLKVGASTIPHAGAGAFAVRPIPKGGLVTPAPLIHIPHGRDLMNMYQLDWGECTDEEEEDEVLLPMDEDKVLSEQLLLNYVFAHPDSDMLLYPFGMSCNVINHASHDDDSSEKEPNAKLVWSKMDFNTYEEWKELTVEELNDDEYARIGLMMDVVATKDIAAGEEVFMDYGPLWQKAWNDHVNAWQVDVKDGILPPKWPLSALDVNAMYTDNQRPYKTPAERKEEPYPFRVMTICYVLTEDPPVGKKRREDDGTQIRWWTDKKKSPYHGEHMFECEVIDRTKTVVDGDNDDDDNNGNIYTVRIEKGSEALHVYGVPHQAIKFLDKPEMSDQYNTHSFRHPIGIPDELFPEAWKNLLKKDDKEEEGEDENVEDEDEDEVVAEEE